MIRQPSLLYVTGNYEKLLSCEMQVLRSFLLRTQMGEGGTFRQDCGDDQSLRQVNQTRAGRLPVQLYDQLASMEVALHFTSNSPLPQHAFINHSSATPTRAHDSFATTHTSTLR